MFFWRKGLPEQECEPDNGLYPMSGTNLSAL